jgi:hypothetical protein
MYLVYALTIAKVGSLLLSLLRSVYWSIEEFQVGGSSSDLITCNLIDMTIPSTRHYHNVSGGHLRNAGHPDAGAPG